MATELTNKELTALILELMETVSSGGSGSSSGSSSSSSSSDVDLTPYTALLNKWSGIATSLRGYLTDTSSSIYDDLLSGVTVTNDNAWQQFLRCVDAILKANSLNYADLIDDVDSLTTIVAGKASVGALQAIEADIDDLQADKADIASLQAIEADIDDLEADKADISDLTALEASISSLNASKANVSDLTAAVARIGTLEASQTTTTNLDALTARVSSLESTKIDASYLTADHLESATLDVMEANMDELFADYLKADDIVTGTLTVDSLLGVTAEFLSLIAQTVSSASIQSFVISSDHISIRDAFITNAMIQSINANKITAGSIDTANVSIVGADNKMTISDGLIQLSDETYVRVQIGRISANNYDMRVWDASGNMMWSASGITAAAIKSAIITDSHIASDANISANKINIASLVTSLNANGGITTSASNITVDSEGQTLSAWFQTMDSWKTGVINRTSTLETEMTAVQGELATAITQSDLTTIENDIAQLQTNYSSMSQTVTGLSTTVSSHTTELSGISSDVSDINDILDESSWLTQSEVDTITSSLNTTISQQASNITATVTSNVQTWADGEYVKQDDYERWFTADSTGLKIGSSTSPIILRLSNDGIKFYTVSGSTETEIGFWDGSVFHTRNIIVDVNYYARFGSFEFVPKASGALLFRKV